MPEHPEHEAMIENVWRTYLTRGDILGFDQQHWFKFKDRRNLFQLLPSNPRCKLCSAPFKGIGGTLLRLSSGKAPSRLNPQFCNDCEQFAEQYQGGAEIELSMLFADVRGSTTLAEKMSPAEYSRLIDRFYKTVTAIMVRSNALIEKLIGDEVTGLYVPGLAGPMHARVAVEAAQKILQATGHADSSGPWIPVGAGVHTGIAFVGAVGSEDGLTNITALGDAVNTAARLASQARQGEVIVSQEACLAAEMDTSALEYRHLQLKGRSELVDVHVIRVSPG